MVLAGNLLVILAVIPPQSHYGPAVAAGMLMRRPHTRRTNEPAASSTLLHVRSGQRRDVFQTPHANTLAPVDVTVLLVAVNRTLTTGLLLRHFDLIF